jgi:shikimate kinase
LRTNGEDRFRELEYDTLCDAVRDDIIYSCGGGVVRTEAARKLLATLPTVWLDAPDEVLLIRVADGDRPLLGGDLRAGIARLRAERSALYDEVAALRVNADDDIDNIVSAIADFVEKRS